MDKFEYNGSPTRVLFGRGTIKQLSSELDKLKITSPIFLSTRNNMEKAISLATIVSAAGVFGDATMHTPTDVTERALRYARSIGADGIISFGGGSTIGLGKAIAVRTGIPHLCIPMTYAGSEMTPILGETENGLKKTRRDPAILPNTVIYDVDLTETLPLGFSAMSGVNAIAHAVEALYAQNTNPVMSIIALEGVRALAEALPTLVTGPNPTRSEARTGAFYGAWLCGTCLGSVEMALHHKLCHTLGGSFNLPHAQTHTIMLPHILAYNAPAIPGVLEKLAKVLPGSDGDAVHGLNLLLDRLGTSRSLKDCGLKEEDIAKAAEIAVANPYANPRKVERHLIEQVIRRAWIGENAKADL